MRSAFRMLWFVRRKGCKCGWCNVNELSRELVAFPQAAVVRQWSAAAAHEFLPAKGTVQKGGGVSLGAGGSSPVPACRDI